MIDYLQEFASEANCGVVHVYFNYNEQHQQRLIDILASLVKQLSEQRPELLPEIKDIQSRPENEETKGKMYLALVKQLGIQGPEFSLRKKDFHARPEENRMPNEEELYLAFVGLSKAFTQTLIIFDALDECHRWNQQESLLPMFDRLGKDGFKLLVTSRRFADDIEKFFEAIPTIQIEAHECDIRTYIYKRLNLHPAIMRIIHNSKREEEIVTQLVEASGGM